MDQNNPPQTYPELLKENNTEDVLSANPSIFSGSQNNEVRMYKEGVTAKKSSTLSKPQKRSAINATKNP